ncbi:unnamed protein product [Cylicocyclus nassatus]|uniref:Peptidase C1A papain C-terminal domain-containing protein n=1 Tax=Cylicocyclus nassatus TaxID=53992 RepID=A0AA36LZU2_CYLNA|nr:unnamed protein product [Cylicocyclus nassatus]
MVEIRKFLEEYKAQPLKEDVEHMTGQELVDYINTNQNLYKARYKPGIERFVQSRIMKAKYMDKTFAEKTVERREFLGDDPLPESFDARDKWPKCAGIIGHIRDQSECGSCWAVASTEVMSDRLCIQSDAKYAVHISDTDLLACCGLVCGGCDGGYTLEAWIYFKRSGICTGGPYGDKNCCKPYAFYPCDKHENQTYYGPCPPDGWETPTCRNRCHFSYRKDYETDKFWGKDVDLTGKNETNIRKEIYRNGPVIASFDVYADFIYYESGVYVHKTGAYKGGHAVKIIGWGTENGVPYWLVANSWNTDWGENGFFRILRGTNECDIERGILCGDVDLDKVH